MFDTGKQERLADEPKLIGLHHSDRGVA